MLFKNKCLGTCAYMGGVPAVLEDFCYSWGNLIQYNQEMLCRQGEYVNYMRTRMSYHCAARNEIAKNFKGDWLFFTDCDHAFDPDLCARLLHRMDSHKVDVIVGVYTYKSPPHSPLLYLEDPTNHLYQPVGGWDGDAEIMEIGSAGAGALMVRRCVFDKIKKELDEEPFSILHPLSEDHSFFRRCKQVGVKAYFDPRIETHHLAIKKLSLKDYDQSAIKLSEKTEVCGLSLG
jgi:glycosyltransferase involved in cell wall biosynthesis